MCRNVQKCTQIYPAVLHPALPCRAMPCRAVPYRGVLHRYSGGGGAHTYVHYTYTYMCVLCMHHCTTYITVHICVHIYIYVCTVHHLHVHSRCTFICKSVHRIYVDSHCGTGKFCTLEVLCLWRVFLSTFSRVEITGPLAGLRCQFL